MGFGLRDADWLEPPCPPPPPAWATCATCARWDCGTYRRGEPGATQGVCEADARAGVSWCRPSDVCDEWEPWAGALAAPGEAA